MAPAAVLTVRTYGTRQLYDPGLVRKFSSREPRTCRPQRHASPEPKLVSQLGLSCIQRANPPRGHVRRSSVDGKEPVTTAGAPGQGTSLEGSVAPYTG